MLSIYLNGKNLTQNKDSHIEELLKLLETEPLDKNFEDFGNFVYDHPRQSYEGNENIQGMTCFFGSFRYFSYPFRVCTDEPEIIEKLYYAIRNNQQESNYINQESIVL